MCIDANMRKINYALSLIEGATQLAEDWYWSSTENGATHAWRLNLHYGLAGGYSKATYQLRVRPVSAFIYLLLRVMFDRVRSCGSLTNTAQGVVAYASKQTAIRCPDILR